MKSSIKPTYRQIRLLTQFKITAPPTTNRACSSLIEFILHGPEIHGKTPVERARFVRKWQNAWVRVMDGASPFFGQIGRVTRLRMRTKEQVSAIQECHKVKALPFSALVRITKQSSSVDRCFPLSSLKITESPQQLLLFSL